MMRPLPSPNFSKRPQGQDSIQHLVFHYTGMPTLQASLERLRSRDEPHVSAHYVIAEDGAIFQLVEDVHAAWHAGLSYWRGQEGLNATSLGLEIQNSGKGPFPDAQIDAVTMLSKHLIQRYKIPPHHIVGHSDIAPDRKNDPGPFFPWQRLAQEGIGFWAGNAPQAAGSLSDLQRHLKTIGYHIDATGVLDAQTAAVLKAFQTRFVRGSADTFSVAAHLAKLSS